MTGATMPSGTPFRLAAQLNREAGSMFVYRRQEAGLFIQEIFRDWVLPYIVKEIKKAKDLTAELQPEELEALSDALAQIEEMRFAKDVLLSPGTAIPTEADRGFVRSAARDAYIQSGARKAFAFPDKFFDDWEGNTDVITTGEQENKEAAMETLFNLFQVLAKFPTALQDPVLKGLFNQIVEKAGSSPITLGTGRASGTEVPTAPAVTGAPTEVAPAAPTV